MWQDLRQAIRFLRRHRSFVCVATLILALGISLNIAIFSIANTVLFKPLAVASPGELVSIYMVLPFQPDRPQVVAGAHFQFLKQHNEAFTDLTGHWGVPYTLHADDMTDAVNGEWVTANYFDVLGIRPALGRGFTTSDDSRSSPERAVVISHSLWTRRFGSDPGVIGKEITLTLWNQLDLHATIVGVTGQEFYGISDPWKPTQVWLTFAQGGAEWRGGRMPSLAPIARLKSGVSIERAQAIISVQTSQMLAGSADQRPRFVVYRTSDIRLPFDPAAAVIPARLAAAMALVVALVLLVAATNIAGIQIARGVGRTGEIAVRRVLGATSWRIVRQLLSESLLLSLAGAVCGWIIARWLLGAFAAVTPMQFAIPVVMDDRVALFTILVSVACGLFVGLMPAKQATSVDVLPSLTGTGAMHTQPGAMRLRRAFTVAQVTASLVLLLVAGFYVRALLRVELAALGYQPRNLLVAVPMFKGGASEAAVQGQSVDQREAERRRHLFAQLLAGLRALPSSPDVAIASTLPLREPPERPNWSVLSEEEIAAGARAGVGAERAAVSPGYFRAMGIWILAGRDFDERDTATAPKVTVMSAALARRLWPGQDPVGRTVAIQNAWALRDKGESYRIVGVVNEVRPIFREHTPPPSIYISLGQQWRPESAYVLIRGTGDSRGLIAEVKSVVRGVEALADVASVQLMSQMIGELLYPRRIAAGVLTISSLVALLLAIIGVYAVVSYSVAQRTSEIGIRLALGAERDHIVRLVIREGVTIATLSSSIGVLLGLAAIRVTASRNLAAVQVDLTTAILVPLLLSAIVVLACYLPARRAGRLDAMAVLRRL
jgi:putative ABC transport system permease protein